MKRISLVAPALAALALCACFKPDGSVEQRLGWNAPLFLDSGRIGAVMAHWTEVTEGCRGPIGFWNECDHDEKFDLLFVSFDPGAGKVDTVFRMNAGRPYASQTVPVRLRGATLVYGRSWEGEIGVYDKTTGVHRVLAVDKSAGYTHLSRSGLYWVGNRSRLNLQTLQVDSLPLDTGLRVVYYDDVANAAYVARAGRSEMGAVYRFATSTLDTSDVFHCDRSSLTCGIRVFGRALLMGPYAVEGPYGSFRIARLDTFAVGTSRPDTVRLRMPAGGSGAPSPWLYDDLDPDARLFLRRPGSSGYTHIFLADFEDRVTSHALAKYVRLRGQ